MADQLQVQAPRPVLPNASHRFAFKKRSRFVGTMKRLGRQSSSPTPEASLQTKTINIARKGHFYERASSRKFRNKTALELNGEVSRDVAVPLGGRSRHGRTTEKRPRVFQEFSLDEQMEQQGQKRAMYIALAHSKQPRLRGGSVGESSTGRTIKSSPGAFTTIKPTTREVHSAIVQPYRRRSSANSSSSRPPSPPPRSAARISPRVPAGNKRTACKITTSERHPSTNDHPTFLRTPQKKEWNKRKTISNTVNTKRNVINNVTTQIEVVDLFGDPTTDEIEVVDLCDDDDDDDDEDTSNQIEVIDLCDD